MEQFNNNNTHAQTYYSIVHTDVFAWQMPVGTGGGGLPKPQYFANQNN